MLRSFSRLRKRLCLLLVPAFLMGVLSGCVGTSSENRSNRTSSSNETLTFAQSQGVALLDPQMITAGYDTNVAANFFENLFRLKPGTFEIEPWLAEKYVMSDDGLSYTFHLKQGVVFHDGEKFNAEAAKINFDRVLSGQGSKYPYKATLFSNVSDVQIVDYFTIKINMLRLDADFLLKLSSPAGFGFISPKAIAENGESDTGVTKNPIGTGPYKFVSHSKDDNVTLTRNDSYWKEKAKCKTFIVKFIKDEAARVQALRNGEVDIISDVTADVASQIESAGLKVVKKPAPMVNYMMFNQANGVFADKAARQAIIKAIDVKKIAESLYKGFATPAAVFLPPVLKGFDKDAKFSEYDPDVAKKELEALGIKRVVLSCYTASKPYNPVGADLGSAISGELRKVGVEVEIKNKEWAAHQADLKSGNFELGFSGWMADYPSASNFFQIFRRNDGINYQKFSSQEFDDLALQASSILGDETKREPVYKEMGEVMRKEAACLPISHGMYVFGASSKLENLHLGNKGMFYLVSKT